MFILPVARWAGWAAVDYKVRTGLFGLCASAEIYEAINHRDQGLQERGSVMIQPEFQVAPRWAVLLGTGIASVAPPGGSFLDGPAAIPVGAGVFWQAYRGAVIHVDATGTFWFDDVLGPSDGSTSPR